MEQAGNNQTPTAQAAGQVAGKNKPQIVRDAEGFYSVLEVDAQGNQRTKGNLGHIAPIDAMEEREAVFMFLGLAAQASNKRAGSVTLLGNILKEQLTRVEAWQGKGDPQKGLDNELKGAFQKCEDKYFEKYMDEKHPDYAIFVGRLPKEDARGNALHIDGKLVPAKQFEAFLTATRREPAYANAKNVVLSYFNLCGRLPYDEAGKLVPPEIMAQEVANARILVPRDNSLKARLYELRGEMMDEKKAPPGDDIPAILRTLREMVEYAQQLENVHAARMTAKGGARVGDSIDKKSQDAIAQAQASSSLQPINRVTVPPVESKPEVKTPEPEVQT